VPDQGHVLPAGSGEEALRLAAQHLGRGFQVDRGIGEQPREGKARVGQALLSAQQVDVDQRAVHPGHHVRVHQVRLAEAGLHAPGLEQQVGRQGGERDVALFHAHLVGAEREEEVGPREGVDHRLQRELRLVEREGRARVDVVLPGGGDEVADHGHVGVEHLRGRRRRGRR
jgi:hypothetical protein